MPSDIEASATSAGHQIITRRRLLAETDVPDFAFCHHLLELLPGRVGILSEVIVDFLSLALLERHRPVN